MNLLLEIASKKRFPRSLEVSRPKIPRYFRSFLGEIQKKITHFDTLSGLLKNDLSFKNYFSFTNTTANHCLQSLYSKTADEFWPFFKCQKFFCLWR